MLLKEEDIVLGFRSHFDKVDLKHKLKSLVSYLFTRQSVKSKDKKLVSYAEKILTSLTEDIKPTKYSPPSDSSVKTLSLNGIDEASLTPTEYAFFKRPHPTRTILPDM
jgi:hypothetical protein